MGYDMTIENTPEDEAVSTQEAKAAFYTAAQERDRLDLPPDHPDALTAQAAVERAYDAMLTADTSYFRLNIWGMGRYRELMDQFGMVVCDYDPPPWPHVPDDLTDEEVDEAATAAPGAAIRPEVHSYLKQVESHLSWHPEPVFGIALHKCCSNDGWLVTPEEITAALESYRTHDNDEVRVLVGEDELDYWHQWITYLERARHRGGFRIW
ncbi:hypothetical protein [Streptomyces sp. NPDC059009]|uniref:hypothetical protein n=1 Tax=Streptomyces sp. NPDC059009 TaxID=3346694 RepID=UPI0036CB8112